MTNSNDGGPKGGGGGKQPGEEQSSNKRTTTTAPPPRQQQANPPPLPPPRHPQDNPPPPRPTGATRARLGHRGAAARGGTRVGGGGIRVGGGAEGSAGRAADISNARPQKRKASEVRAPEGVRSICAVCNREFKNFKALFGHMRSHPNRPWRGCFPPPGFENPQQHPPPPPGGRAALNIDLNRRPRRQRAVFDLNLRLQPQTGESSDAADKEVFDLNKRPSPDDDAHNDRN